MKWLKSSHTSCVQLCTINPCHKIGEIFGFNFPQQLSTNNIHLCMGFLLMMICSLV